MAGGGLRTAAEPAVSMVGPERPAHRLTKPWLPSMITTRSNRTRTRIAFRMIGNPERSAVVSWETANFVSSIGGLANPFWLAETAAEAVRLSLLRPPADSGDVQLRDSIRRRLAAAAPEELAASSLFHLAGYPIEDVATTLSVDVTSARRYAQLLSPPPGVTYKHLGDPALIGEDEVEPEPVVDAGTMADRKVRRTRWVRSAALLLAGTVAVAIGAALSVGDRPTLESGATTASNTGAPPSPLDTSSAAVRAPTGCSNERPPSGVATVPITAGSGTYRLAIPPAPTGVNANDAAPLLIAVPGYGQSAQSFVDTTQLEAQGVASGVVVATYDPAEPALEVNTVGDPERPDDLDGVAAMLDDVRSKVCVDPSQVHLVGFGPGAQLAGQLACRRSTEVSSVVAVSGGALPEDCNLDPPVSSLLLWNADDDVLPVAGGYGPSHRGGGTVRCRCAPAHRRGGRVAGQPMGVHDRIDRELAQRRGRRHDGRRLHRRPERRRGPPGDRPDRGPRLVRGRHRQHSRVRGNTRPQRVSSDEPLRPGSVDRPRGRRQRPGRPPRPQWR